MDLFKSVVERKMGYSIERVNESKFYVHDGNGNTVACELTANEFKAASQKELDKAEYPEIWSCAISELDSDAIIILVSFAMDREQNPVAEEVL